MIPLSLNMPSILNTPANKIPIHFFHLPVAQREVLLVSVLTDPILYKSIIASVTVRGCGLFLSVIHLPPLSMDSLMTFTVLVIFFDDTFRYIVW